MSSRLLVSVSVIAAGFVCLSVPLNMGGCAEDVTRGVGQATGQSAPSGTDNYIRAGQKAVQATTLNEADEDAMGQSVALTLTNRYGLNDDETLAKYVNLVGLTIASVSPRPDGNWVFGVINSNDVNAYAGPNGYIMIIRGALAKMQDEAKQLAGVLAHEIAHVSNQDGLKAVKQAGLLDAGVEAGSGANSTFAQFSKVTDGVVDVVIKKGYSRDQEMSADLDAVKFLVAAGYDPNSYLHYLKRMKAASGSSSGSLMSTHPGLDQRIAKVSAQIPPGQTGATLKDRFAANVKP